jgi:hypothetical protein
MSLEMLYMGENMSNNPVVNKIIPMIKKCLEIRRRESLFAKRPRRIRVIHSKKALLLIFMDRYFFNNFISSLL